jgi:general secretion pathway protein K
MKFLDWRPQFKQQQGAAILTAMLTVVLVASLAASTLWQQWRGVEIETAERARVQAAWVLTGALDWARLILREDGRKGGADHLAEPWAIPLEQARMSTFLAADRSDTVEEDGIQGAFLSGRMLDLQSRLNLTNLVQAGKIDEPSRLAFGRLFDLLKLPVDELDILTDNLRLMQDSSAAGLANAETPLWPQELEQLAWLGLSPLTIAQLRPYVTILPVPTPVNLNTASTEVIYACVTGLELADATRLVRERDAKHLSALTEAGTASGNAAAKFNAAQHSVSTRFFEVRGSLQLDQVTVQEQSLVQRDGMEVKTLRRKRSVPAPEPNLQ